MYITPSGGTLGWKELSEVKVSKVLWAAACTALHCTLPSFHTTVCCCLINRLKSLWCIFGMHRCSLLYAWLSWSVPLPMKCGQPCTAAFCSPRLFRRCDTLRALQLREGLENRPHKEKRGNVGLDDETKRSSLVILITKLYKTKTIPHIAAKMEWNSVDHKVGTVPTFSRFNIMKNVFPQPS